MLEVTLNIGNNQAVYPFPELPKEAKLTQYISFDTSFVAMRKFLQEKEGEELVSDFSKLEYFKMLQDCLFSFWKGKKEIDDVPLGSFEDHLLIMYGIDKIEDFDFVKSEKTLFTFFANIYKVIYRYQPKQYVDEDFSFEYKGEVYFIPRIYRDAISGTLRYEEIACGRAVEALEVVRLYEEAKKHDDDGSLNLTSTLKLIAITALKEDEEFPANEQQIERFVNDRLLHFQDIDLETALDVKDFFFNTTKTLKAAIAISSFLSHHKSKVAEKPKRRPSARQGKRTKISSKG